MNEESEKQAVIKHFWQLIKEANIELEEVGGMYQIKNIETIPEDILDHIEVLMDMIEKLEE